MTHESQRQRIDRDKKFDHMCLCKPDCFIFFIFNTYFELKNPLYAGEKRLCLLLTSAITKFAIPNDQSDRYEETAQTK